MMIYSNKKSLGLVIDTQNYYSYILSEKMPNSSFNSCYDYEFDDSSSIPTK